MIWFLTYPSSRDSGSLPVELGRVEADGITCLVGVIPGPSRQANQALLPWQLL